MRLTMTDPMPHGLELLQDPRLNKGTAFSEAERDALGLRGLLPPRVVSPEDQRDRVLENFRGKPTPLEQYIYLISLMDRNEHLFYRIVMDNVAEMLPVIYTPTVGEACRRFGHIFRRPRGLYLSIQDRGRVRELLGHWPTRQVGIIVVTDGERILGLGDLGANGMGIPIGKLSLYTACAGVDPALCLPVTLDTGTSRAELRDDPLYLGLPVARVRGAPYEELVEEFVTGVQDVFPGALIQFEDFATENALALLARYRDRVCCFNDDIQGTAAVTLAGLLSAARVTGQPLRDQRILFLGAGSAATGIADLIVAALVRDGLPQAEARRRCWFVDRGGLVVASRTDLAAYKRPYAHETSHAAGLLPAVEQLRPTALVGVSAQGGGFPEEVVRAMSRINTRPIIFPLSNPTSQSECTAAEAYRWSDGRAVFASGSPFPPVTYEGRTYLPGQGNNAYIFPGVGLGVILTRARRVTDAMFHVAAGTLAAEVSEASLAQGQLFPPLGEIRRVSAAIATAVAEVAFADGLATVPRPADLAVEVRAHIDR
ncbi:MAG TPA: NAD-dependent malic enzyme, partial [Gemmatimonadales bacterium]|nr:NAD-dependent malic enzyme [Gemmatimonadales bacterium]